MAENIVKKNLSFFLVWILLIFLGSAFILVYPKPEFFIILNKFHIRPLDYFFRMVTFLGDGIFIIITALFFFLKKNRALSFMIISSYLISGIVVKALKNFFPVPRPAMYFQLNNISYTNFLDGVTLHNYYSFPSGHTASAFALVASVAMVSTNKKWGGLLAISAAIIGYSRIYLGQHFPEDVVAGMAIGAISSVICFVFLWKLFCKWEGRLNKNG